MNAFTQTKGVTMRSILAVAAALALTLSACGTETTTPTPTATNTTTADEETTTAASGPIIKPFGEPLTGTDGKEVTIESASSDGKHTTIALRYQAGDEAIETYNILTPTLNYGPDGTTADVVKLPDVSGVIVPGRSKVITYPFDVAVSELSEATLTIMVGLGSASWTGDLTAYIAESSSVGEAPEPSSSIPAEEAAPAVQQAPATVEAEPYVVECLFGTPGPSRMSDGSIQSTDYCANQPGAAESRFLEGNCSDMAWRRNMGLEGDNLCGSTLFQDGALGGN